MLAENKKIYISILLALLVISIIYKKNNSINKKDIRKYNIILISIDTLRADHLSCYGYNRLTSPNIDNFAKDSIICLNHIANASSTAPSHASILTGLIPSKHKVLFTLKTRLSESIPNISTILKKYGYTTISYNGGAQLNAQFGFNNGFDTYISLKTDKFNKNINYFKKFIKNYNSRKPFFMFLHTYQTHHPYTPNRKNLYIFEKQKISKLPETISIELLKKINKKKIKINNNDLEHIINTYDAEIFEMDKSFHQLIIYLKSKKLYKKTLIIFTSDHGEEFNEHGWVGWHSHTLYNELLKVPLIIKFPDFKFKNLKLKNITSGVDILPTILNILNIPIPTKIDGTSIIKIYKNNLKLYAISQQDSPLNPLPFAIQNQFFKLYNDKLFNLKNDPFEYSNISFDYPDKKQELKKIFDLRLKNKIIWNNEYRKITNIKLEKLKKLGYIN